MFKTQTQSIYDFALKSKGYLVKTSLLLAFAFMMQLLYAQAPTPEVLYYTFDGSGTSVPNQASSPPAGTATATLMGGLTQGGTNGACGTGAVIGTGAASSTDYVNTGWAPNLGNSSWTISFRTQGISTNGTLYYIFGDANTASFRCFTNGIAGSTNWVLRGAGLTDIFINGGALSTPTVCTYVYDNTLNNVKGYLNGTLVTTVAQVAPNLTGTGPLKVIGYATNVGAPAGGTLDNFRFYSRALTGAEVLSLNTTGLSVTANTTEDSVCAGQSITLTGSGGPTGTSYTWDNGVTDSVAFTVDSSEIYTLVGAYGACTDTQSIAITVKPSPEPPTISASTDTTCAGTQITLTATPAAGETGVEYLWYKNGTAINSGTSPTYMTSVGTTGGNINYSLEMVYASAPECISQISSTPTVVTVNAPSVTITPSGPTTYCVNNPTTLNSTGGYNNYLWKRSTTTVQNGTAAAYIPTASGNHNVTVTDAFGCMKTSSWTNLTINPLPTANAGVDKGVCTGSSVQIGGPAALGNTYLWTPANSLSNAGISNPMASPVINTTYTLTVTTTATGCSKSDMVDLSMLSAPSIPSISSTTTPVCEGGTISITPTSIGANNINWYKNGAFLYNKPTNYIQTITTPTAAAEAYTIASKGVNGCVSGQSNVINAWVKIAATPTITTNPAASGNVCTVCVPGGTSGNAILVASSTTASPTYSWKLAGNFIAGANQSSYLSSVSTSQNNKVYNVQATYPNGCIKTSAAMTVTLVTSGCTPRLGSDKEDADMLINDDLSLGLYPNPTSSRLNVEILNSLENQGKITLYNALGQIVLEKEISLNQGQANEELDLSHLSAGVYSLSFQTTNSHKVQKLVKE